jgi:hypothetical protein
MLSSTLVQIWIKYYISCFMYYLLPTTQKVEKITEFVSESIPKFISIIWENIGWIWGLPFMDLNKLDVKNKNTSLYCIFYILFIRNQRKNWLPNKYRFRPFSSLIWRNKITYKYYYKGYNVVGTTFVHKYMSHWFFFETLTTRIIQKYLFNNIKIYVKHKLS